MGWKEYLRVKLKVWHDLIVVFKKGTTILGHPKIETGTFMPCLEFEGNKEKETKEKKTSKKM